MLRRLTFLGVHLALVALLLGVPARAEHEDRGCGDPSGDGRVDVSDVVLSLRYTVGLDEPTFEQLVQVDVAPAVTTEGPVLRSTPDGAVDVADTVLILRLGVALSVLEECSPLPALHEVAPAVTCPNAGNTVTVWGDRLLPEVGTPRVVVALVEAAVVRVERDAESPSGQMRDAVTVTTAQATAPAEEEAVDVLLTTSTGTSRLRGALTLKSSCDGPPSVDIIQSESQPIPGSLARLIGAGLACLTGVTFVGVESGLVLPAAIRGVMADFEALIEIPGGHSACWEYFDVVTTGACGTSTLAAGWCYTCANGIVPNGMQVLPSSGPTGGGNSITLTGIGVFAATEILVGPTVLECGEGFSVDGSIVTIASMPPSPAGPDVLLQVEIVAINGVLADPTPVPYTYVP